MKGFEIKFNIYAESESEIEDAREAIIGFIDYHALQGRAVSARKIADAIRSWEKNVIVRNEIIKYFS